MDPSADARAGARMLSEIEESTLEEFLHALRLEISEPPPTTTTAPAAPTVPSFRKPKSYPIPELDSLVSMNFRNTRGVPLQLTGRYMPLVYKLVSTLVTPPCLKAVVVIDAENQLDCTRLTAPSTPDQQADAEEDFDHVHVFQPARCSPERLRELIGRSEEWMLYGDHGSRAREWWGTIVIGGPAIGTPIPAPSLPASAQGPRGPSSDVTAGWKGWLRLDREDVPGCAIGASAAEAIVERAKRQDVVDSAAWKATCEWGEFTFAGNAR